ncbi:MAG: tetratricopeptide repeat protein [Planctomycetota bacterium]|nr:tetratricopeptide repeat protein [Planctomycetota bacterium]
MRVAAAILLIVVLLAAPACQMNERLSGTVFGAIGGAVLGGVASGGGGAVVGGLAGGLIGYLIGDYMADQRERGRGSVFGSSSDATVAGIRDEPAHVKAARTAYERGRAAKTAPEAKRWYLESLRLNPDRPEPYNLLGLNALYAGDLDAAEDYLERALTVDPDYRPAQHNLAKLRRELIRR